MRILLPLAVCVFAISVYTQTSLKRDLNKYDDGGFVNFGWDRHCEFGFLGERLRDFIWRHYHEKHLGYIKTAAYAIEGDPTYRTIYIEPDAKGNWQIKIDARFECCWWYGMVKPHKKRTTERSSGVFVSVERVEAKYWLCGYEPTSTGLPVSDDEKLLPSQYLLIVKRRDLTLPPAKF